MNVKLNAVMAGQTLQLLIQDVGTVLRMRSMISGTDAPVRNDCMPKKYELKTGVKRSWFTVTLKYIVSVLHGAGRGSESSIP